MNFIQTDAGVDGLVVDAKHSGRLVGRARLLHALETAELVALLTGRKEINFKRKLR